MLGILCVAVCFQDVLRRKISNKICMVVFLFALLLGGMSGDISKLYSFLCMLFLGFFLFYFGVFSAGDSKLATALAVATPFSILPFALWMTAVIGGGLAAFYWLKYRWLKKQPKGQDPGLPYGVAISVGFYGPLFLHYM